MNNRRLHNFEVITKESLKVLKLLLKREQLCYDDIDIQIHPYFGIFDKNKNLLAGYGLEVYGTDALLRSVVVNKNYRKNGLGNIIIKHAIDYGRTNGIKYYYLLTTTADSFFSKFEFNVIERHSVPNRIASTTEFRTFCPDTAICMKLTLKNNSK